MATKTEKGYAQALKEYEDAKAKLQAIQSKERSFTSLFTSNKEGADALKQFKEAERALARFTKSGQVAQGMLGAGVDVVLGLPDIGSQVINYGIRKFPEVASGINLGTGKVSSQKLSDLIAKKEQDRFQLPVLGDIVKDSLGLRQQAPTEELQIYQDTPGYIAMALGAGQLLKLGWKGFTKFRNSRVTKDLIKSLAPDEANAFKKWMVNGQGTDSTEMQAVINKVKDDPKYAELFNALEAGARAELALPAILPDVADKGSETAAAVASAFDKRLKAIRNYRGSTSGAEFNKATKVAGNEPFIPVDNVRRVLAEMRSRYDSNTTDGNRILAYIDDVEQSLYPRLTIPASASATGKPTVMVLKGATPKLTVKEFQVKMAEMGRKVGSTDAIGSGVASDVKETINKAVFSGFAQDLAVLKNSDNVVHKQAAGHLENARSLYKKGSDALSDAQSQGVPAWLKNKKPNEIKYEDLAAAYKSQNAEQNLALRSWLQDSAPDALAKLDKFVFDDFISTAQKRLPNGEIGYDLGAVAEKWALMSKGDKETLAVTLGQSFDDFSKKMADALAFTKKVDAGAAAGDGADAAKQLSGPVSALVGTSPVGFRGAKATQVAANITSVMGKKGGLSQEQLMKALLTKEGADFLKQARLSPQGRETLDSLMALDKASLPNVGFISAGLKEYQEPTPQFGATPEITLPDTVEQLNEQAAQVPEKNAPQITLPATLEELMGAPAPQEPQNAPEQPTSDPLGEFIQNLPQRQSAAPMPPEQPQQEQEDPLMARIRAEGYSNPEYVYNAVMTGDPKKREFILTGLRR